MAKRRTKEQVAPNEKRLTKLFIENTQDGRTAIIRYRQLMDSGYEGSLPYTVPNTQGIYGIMQLKQIRGEGPLAIQYSIFKLQ